ncbi:DUF488 domain-containing protein [Chitinophaga sp. HK235]|uniref:DUF488 domain-containing protein n=1 Tax=Chitinophaga sp. HK235 TaxID=2952571 RepID=UPI001BAD6A99|nr:DUF488 family protein [Chitinophaga sp. HK235]
MIQIKRVYDDFSENDGYRILVDRLWPRGLTKEHAHVDEWLKEIAPSETLRKWFNHEPEKYPAFRTKYMDELADEEKQTMLEAIRKKALHHRVTLLYGAKDDHHNQARVLMEVLKG